MPAPAAPPVPSAPLHPLHLRALCTTAPSLRQVSNLVDNGLKYCEATSGGASYLGLCCRWDEQEERISIAVWNSAAPLPEEELRRAFAWGARGSAAASSMVGGSGYGLHIVQRLVGLMGGSVSLANEPLPEWLSAVLPPGSDPGGEEGLFPDERPHGVSGCIYLPRGTQR
jgi:signal transduction histidine kinase